MLCYVILQYIVLYDIILYYGKYYIILHYIILYYITLYYITLYYVMLCYVISYYIILFYIIYNIFLFIYNIIYVYYWYIHICISSIYIWSRLFGCLWSDPRFPADLPTTLARVGLWQTILFCMALSSSWKKYGEGMYHVWPFGQNAISYQYGAFAKWHWNTSSWTRTSCQKAKAQPFREGFQPSLRPVLTPVTQS